jgi:hypothetical protein
LLAASCLVPILMAVPAHAQSDHAQTDQAQTDQAQTDHAQTDHAQTDHARADHARTDQPQTGHRQTDRAQTDHARTDQPQTGHRQTDRAASLLEALSLVSGGLLVAPVAAPEVTQDGDHFHVHIPLPTLATPPDAAIEMAATPLDGGIWDITDLTLPPTGTLATPATPDRPPASLRFSIGQQTAHARIDPTLSVRSPYAMALSDIAFHLDSAASPADLTIGQMTLEGAITGDADRRMTTRSRGTAENWHFTAMTKAGTQGGTQGGTKAAVPFSLSVRRSDASYEVDGLDRGQAEHLRQAARAIAESRQAAPAVAGQPRSMSPEERERLRAIIEASVGLLSGFDIEETLQGLHFEATAGNQGDIGTISLAMSGGAANGRAAMHFDIGLNELTLTALPAAYAPHRVAIKTAFSGIPVEPLRHLLRQATEADADPVSLRAQAMALLNHPGAHAGIDTLLIEAGPLVLHGSARLRPMPDGSAGFDVHLTAHGVDAMLAQVQSDPTVQQMLPMLFLAKGMGKQEGDTVVWDIAFADGVVMVNGVPLGQRGGKGSGVRPPANR